VKEGIYLWQKGEMIWRMRNTSVEKPEIYIRPEPQTAQYYKGKQNFLDETILDLQDRCSITVLPRTKEQSAHYRQSMFNRVQVPEKPLSFDDIAIRCSLFIGAGGSMTREMAILGIPTISVYQDALLDVDAYLLSQKLMLHEPNLTSTHVQQYLQSLNAAAPSTELLSKGKQAFQLFIDQIEKYNA
jgi:predicted glycosyltransferase